MKTSTIRVLALFSLIAALGPFALMARAPYRFTIPFGFTAGRTAFAAGSYRVEEVSPNVILIQQEDGQANAMLIGNGAEPVKNTRGIATLTFHRYGDHYFFSKLAAADRGWRVPESRVERELIAKRASPKSLDLVASSGR